MSDAAVPNGSPGARADRAPDPLDAAPLRESLPRLIEAMSDAVVVLDRDGRVIAANRRFVDSFGLSELVVGHACPRAGRCLADGSVGGSCIACEIARLRQPKRAIQVVTDDHGTHHRWEASLNPVLGADGEVELVVEVWRDVTDRSQLEAQLSHSERLASLGLLAAGVAHELNNPLASVLAGIESLQRWVERAKLAPEHANEATEVLTLIEQEVRRCRETTDKLLLLGQPPATRPVWVNLNRAVSDTLALLAFATRRQHIDVSTELADQVPKVWGREGALRGAIMNLCLNAVQAMPDGGRMVVRSRLEDGRVTIEVEDTGPGIPPEHLARIWDPFFTTKPVGQGTGLGLSITQRIVTRHGGTVHVESVPGSGARFTITLPESGVGGDRIG